jgi:ketosteroid isomerase-like protein
MSAVETTGSAVDTVRALDSEISGGDLRKIGDYLADDFQFVGVSPQALGKAESIGVWTTLRAAFPDFDHNLAVTREAGAIVYATVEVTGTHTGAFIVPDGPTIPPTGRKVRNPNERIAITVRAGKVTKWEVEHVPGGGLEGILGQIG